MLKQLHRDDTTVTPYLATKDWQLSNIDNSDLVLSEAGNPIIFEHVSLTPSEVFPDNNCDIAKENQTLDLALYREGLKVGGIFYPQLDPVNDDGTYKRVVYSQIKTIFYNNYRDPTKMWGLEKIDFDSSNTKKFLSDLIRTLNVPTNIMGEKIIEGTIKITDNSIDDIHTITDDKENNLFAGTNLFSARQEIGNHSNLFQSGSDFTCNYYFDFTPPKDSYALTASQVDAEELVYLNWLDSPSEGFNIERGVDNSGSSFSFLSSTPAGVTSSFDSDVLYGHTYWYRVYAFNQWGNSGYSNTASVEIILFGFSNTSFDTVCFNTPYIQSSSVIGGTPPFTYSISGSLPTGLNFDSSSATIFGTSSVMSTSSIIYQIQLNLTDSLNETTSKIYYLNASYCGIWEPWDEYNTGSDVNGLNQGYGFSSPWFVRPDVNLIPQVFSYEDFEEYSTGSNLNGLNSGSGFSSPWYATNVQMPMTFSSIIASPTSSIIADGSSFSTITVTFRDVYNNPVIGATVSMIVIFGHSYSLTSPSPTDINGQTTSQMTTTLAETKIVSVNIPNIGPPVNITFIAAAPNAFASSVIAFPTSGVAANGISQSIVTVTLDDGNFNPCIGQSVVISADGGASCSLSPLTNTSGITSGSVTSTTTGSKNITAVANGSITIAQHPTITFV
jgi:hypothetical protein